MLHGALEVVIGYLFVGVVLGALAGWLADRRGRNFWVYLVFTVVFPGTALISIPYLLIFTRRVKREPTPPESTGDDRLELLERLAKMRDSGALSEDEFQAEKARLLAGVVPQSAAGAPRGVMMFAYLDPGSGGGIGPLEVGVLLFVWILPAFLVARYAKRKGHSFLAFLLIGLLVSWVITGIAALIVEDKRTPREFVVAQAPVDRLDQLQKLTELRRAGTLSQDEFDAEKARIMGD